MIYICADDYGLSESISSDILKCAEKGGLNKVSVFPNFDKIDIKKITEIKKTQISLHLNLVEGKCMSDKCEIDLIAESNGNFKHTFLGLLMLSIFHQKKFEVQIYKEIKAQILYYKSILPADIPFNIDSHQHTHLIPAVFNALIKVLNDEKIKLNYMRIPSEPLLPYIQTPSLYFTYKPINIIKQWLLNFLWFINKKQAEKHKIPTSLFLGILFSGKMDEKKVNKILPKYKKLSKKQGKDIEILFHPGYLKKGETDLKSKNIVFNKFYMSEDRKAEFNSAIKLSERSVKE